MVVLSVLQALHSVSVEVEVQVPINSSPFSKEAHSYTHLTVQDSKV